jgi:ketosteroid isomerase-like protein
VVGAAYDASVSARTERLRVAFESLDRGDLSEFGSLFADGARWLGVPGSGFNGETPI